MRKIINKEIICSGLVNLKIEKSLFQHIDGSCIESLTLLQNVNYCGDWISSIIPIQSDFDISFIRIGTMYFTSVFAFSETLHL